MAELTLATGRIVGLALGMIAATATAPVAQNDAKPAGDASAPGSSSPSSNAEHLLPAELLPVPGGPVTLGSTADQLIEFVTKAKRRTKDQAALLRLMLPELGQKTVEVDPFFLYRTQVTNREYLAFVKATGHRFPFHWWRYGKQEHHDDPAVRKKYLEAFKGKPNPDLYYWEQNWADLPYQIPEGDEDKPVTLVSWLDAVSYAGWAGMRLPTEAEFVRAARADTTASYVAGFEGDKDKLLKTLKISGSRDQRLKEVGAVGASARGVFGHDDMVGNVWEWTSDFAWPPRWGTDSFDKERKTLDRNKTGRELLDLIRSNRGEIRWPGKFRLVKGGSFYSWRAPFQLRISTRVGQDPVQTIEGIGFRVAKSLVPGRDACVSRLLTYDYSFFGGTREPFIGDQLGAERYVLADEGKRIKHYGVIAVVPVNHMGFTRKNRPSKKALIERSLQYPLVVGTLVTTEKIAEPKLEPGTYTVYVRERGMPTQLVRALKEGSRALLRAKKSKGTKETDPKKTAKGAKKKGPTKKDDDKDKKTDWRSVLKRYGITDEEAAVKGAEKKIDFIRLRPGDYRIPATKPLLIFRDSEGKFAGHAVLKAPAIVQTSVVPQTLEVHGSDKSESFRFEFVTPLVDERKRSGKGLKVRLDLDLGVPSDAAHPWRTSAAKIDSEPTKSQSRGGR